MKRCSFFLVFLLIAQPSYGLSLLELQKNALDNRQIIEEYQAKLDQRSSDVTIATSGFLPSLDLSYTINSLDDHTVFEDDENSVAYGAITWNLFSGFYDYYNMHSARLLEKAQFYRLEAIKQNIQLNVSLRYLDIYKQRSQLEVAQESQTTLNKLYDDSRFRYAVGLFVIN
jgi:outer membrane protein